jgi:hypothetical protein
VININQDPALSCRPDAPCRGVCYACKGHYCFANVKNALQGNFWAYLHDPKGYFETISAVVAKKEATAIKRGDEHPIVRWHSAGDIVDARYFKGMIGVAKANPAVDFYAYTKQYEIVNAELAKGTKLPKNFKVHLQPCAERLGVAHPQSRSIADHLHRLPRQGDERECRLWQRRFPLPGRQPRVGWGARPRDGHHLQSVPQVRPCEIRR